MKKVIPMFLVLMLIFCLRSAMAIDAGSMTLKGEILDGNTGYALEGITVYMSWREIDPNSGNTINSGNCLNGVPYTFSLYKGKYEGVCSWGATNNLIRLVVEPTSSFYTFTPNSINISSPINGATLDYLDFVGY